MVFPFFMQAPPLYLWSTRIQMLLVLVCSGAILFADLMAFRRPFVLSDIRKINVSLTLSVAAICLALTCIFTGTHLVLMPKIPFLSLWDLSSTAGQAERLARERAEATKLLPSGPLIDYLSTWALVIFAPIAIVCWCALRRFWMAMFSFTWIAFYAIATTAKFPLVICAASTTLALSATSRYLRKQTMLFVSASIILFLISITTLAFKLSPMFNPKTALLGTRIEMSKTDPRNYDTIADRHRIWSAGSIERRQKISLLAIKTEAIIYRVIFCPSDVSIRWYQYFTTVKSPKGFSSAILRPPPEERPSRLIAIWAYVERFPTLYMSFANANASFDADAFSRKGWFGASLAICIFVGLRFFLIHVRGVGILGTPLYCISITLLSLLPFQSSLQAIIWVYGLWMILGYALVFSIIHKYKGDSVRSQN